MSKIENIDAPWQELDLCKSNECRVCAAECVSVFGLVDGTRTGPLKQGKDSDAQPCAMILIGVGSSSWHPGRKWISANQTNVAFVRWSA